MAYHSYSDDERMAFTEHINNSLASDPVRENLEEMCTPRGSCSGFTSARDGREEECRRCLCRVASRYRKSVSYIHKDTPSFTRFFSVFLMRTGTLWNHTFETLHVI